MQYAAEEQCIIVHEHSAYKSGVPSAQHGPHPDNVERYS